MTRYFSKLSDFTPDFDNYLVRMISDPQNQNNISKIYFNSSGWVDHGKSRHVMHEIAPSSNLKTIALTKAMYTESRSYDEQAFDNMSEESERKNLIVKKSLRPVPIQGVVEEAKKVAASDPKEITQEKPEDPKGRGGRGCA